MIGIKKKKTDVVRRANTDVYRKMFIVQGNDNNMNGVLGRCMRRKEVGETNQYYYALAAITLSR